MWLAPNMVTLLGFCFILINIAFIVIFMPDLVGPVSKFIVQGVRSSDIYEGPSWIYYSFALGLWM